jgi:hypothetical protein
MNKIISESVYERVLAGLARAAHDDWLGMEILTRSLRECFDHRPSYVEVRPVAVRAVHDLINAGAQAGDLAEEGFRPWPMTRQEMIDRLTRALDERTDWPQPNELGWITFPDE